jgi:hypothetical protein
MTILQRMRCVRGRIVLEVGQDTADRIIVEVAIAQLFKKVYATSND